MTSWETLDGRVKAAVIVILLVGAGCLYVWEVVQISNSTLSTGRMQNEKLAIYPYANSTTVLTLQISNPGPPSATVTQVTLNGTEAEGFGYLSYGGDFTGVTGGEKLGSGQNGTVYLTFGAAPARGTTYNINVITAAGNIFPQTLTWP